MLLYILIAVLMFGALIAVHEFGHFAAAKLLGVRVNEFAIGMGPKLLSGGKGETLYTLRAFPVGGFCAMEGEEDASDDPRSFSNKPAWKKFIILVAGAFMNFLIGFILILVLFAQNEVLLSPVVSSFETGFPYQGETGLQAGDRILSIDGHRILVYEDVSLFFGRSNGATMDLVVERDGQKVALNDFPLKPQNYTVDGKEIYKYGIYFTKETATLGAALKNGCYQAADYVRVVWLSLGDLVTGAVGLKDLSGPIGIVNMIGQVGETAPNIGAAAVGILNFVAFIAINLAVMNLLPIPALDGGQILFLLVNGVYALFSKKRIDQKYLGYINMAGFFCLIALMVVVAVSDVIKLVG